MKKDSVLSTIKEHGLPIDLETTSINSIHDLFTHVLGKANKLLNHVSGEWKHQFHDVTVSDGTYIMDNIRDVETMKVSLNKLSLLMHNAERPFIDFIKNNLNSK